MNVADLPPWGEMDRRNRELMKKRPIPEAWRPLGGGNREDEFKKWFAALVHDLETLIWPQYLRDQKKWKSPPNADLIHADFDIMKGLVKELDSRIKGITRPKDPNETPTHLVLFKEEDNPNDFFGTRYERYDDTFPPWLMTGLGDLLFYGLNHRLGCLQLQLKEIFQRPRAYQVAHLLCPPDSFEHRYSNLANTPAFISGHCIQGVLGVCGIFPTCATSVDAVSIDVLKQFMVDIGDRRVFAGVHYPSDNLGSWYTVFKLLPHVMDPSSLSAVRAFLWDAIDNYSTVYAEIKKHAAGANSPYAPIVTELKKVATT